MEIVSAVLVGATLINAAKDLVELCFMVGDDPARQKRMRLRTSGFYNNGRGRHYLLTIEGNRVIAFDPLD